MLDYRGIETLAKIVECNSFELASQVLFVSQSAISQRLKSLQTYYGDPLLIKGADYQLTQLGEVLVSHYRRVESLEVNLQSYLSDSDCLPQIHIAISRDSLETWFNTMLFENKLFDKYKIKIITDDQDHTLEYLKKGLCSICFSTQKDPLPNCQSIFVGTMDYRLVATKAFKKKHYFGKVRDLLNAPALIYDKKDTLHYDYLAKNFDIRNENLNYHILPSVRGFKETVLRGYAYALLPEIDILDELKLGKLIELFPGKTWSMATYLHGWEFGSKAYNGVIELLTEQCRKLFTLSQ